jgi:hypothetical protein
VGNGYSIPGLASALSTVIRATRSDAKSDVGKGARTLRLLPWLSVKSAFDACALIPRPKGLGTSRFSVVAAKTSQSSKCVRKRYGYSVLEDHRGDGLIRDRPACEARRLQAGRVALSLPAGGEGDWVGALAQAHTQSSWRGRSPGICLTRKPLLPARRIRRRPTRAASWREVAGHIVEP